METIRWNTETGEVTNFDKLFSMLDNREPSLKRIAYYIRSSEDYQFVVDFYRQAEIDYKGCIGAIYAFENLQRLPTLMTGYKERFILSTF
jgi:hypothetical protein|tara:strand:- start:317 stop:586 length:270 start_codon:yes stop_codon:yes gene_type:complete